MLVGASHYRCQEKTGNFASEFGIATGRGRFGLRVLTVRKGNGRDLLTIFLNTAGGTNGHPIS
jgi:hypothetical protein